MRGADALVQALAACGCDTIFALSGNQIMPVFDACLDAGIRLIHTRHEAAAGYMAEGHAQVTGRPGVALVTAGAGLGNAIAPLMTARASQTPLILLSGDSPVALDGAGAFQEMDQVTLTQSVTKWSCRVTDPGDLAQVMVDAWHVAQSSQPGPVHISLPADVLEATVAAAALPGSPQPAPLPDLSDLTQAIATAERPLILLGPGLRGLSDAVSGLKVPVVTMQSPRGANDPSLGAFRAAWAQADLVVALGKPVDFSVGYGRESLWPKARWITVHGADAEAARARRNLGARLVQGMQADPKAVLRALEIMVWSERRDWCGHVAELLGARQAETSEGLTSASLVQAVANILTPHSTLVCDGGEFGQWAQTIQGGGIRIVNGVSGAIGAGICYAMGARAAHPDAPVIALMGDGTAGFHLPEFETAAREGLPFVAVIGNDQRWNAEHQIQMRQFGADRTHSCALSGMRYDLAVQAMGGFGVHVTQLAALEDALQSALDSRLPACVNVEIEGLPAPVFATPTKSL